MAFIDTNGGRLYFEARGEGFPLILVHGLACAHEDWEHQVAHFAPGHRVVTLDLRGHGRSTGHVSGFDMHTYAADVAALMAHLELDRALLAGHSMGTRVVLECARSAPERVAGLVLVDGSKLATGDPESGRRAVRAAIRDAGYGAFLERLFTQMFIGKSDPATRDAIVARARRMPEAVGSALMAEMVAWDAGYSGQAWRSATMPVTVVQSTHLNAERERVPLAPGETSDFLELAKRLAPHCEVAVVAGVGHFTMIEAPDAVNRYIEAMLERLAR